jgi:hypothetical protein
MTDRKNGSAAIEALHHWPKVEYRSQKEARQENSQGVT